MKKSIIGILMSLSISFVYSQENTLPQTGNIGVGTLSPTEKLEVKGNVKVDSCVLVKDSIIIEKNARIKGDEKIEGSLNVAGKITGYDGLILEGGNAKFKNNAVVENNLRVLNHSKILGNQTVEGDLKLPNINVSNASNLELLMIGNNGKVVKSPGIGNALADIVYNKECLQLQDGSYTPPTWRNKPGVVYVGAPCPPDARVGIRTQDPDAVLQVNGNAHINQEAWFDKHILVKDYIKVGGSSIWIGNSDQSTGTNNNIYSTGGDLKIQSGTGSDFNTYINQLNNGSLIIGNVSNPEYKVEVAGTIRSCKFIAEANTWCDYVFDSTYVLRPLSEVKDYIKVNHHLPEVPSTQEVEKNGVDLVDMETILLKKVEELTLYMIQLKEENDELKTKVEELNKKIANDE